MRLVCTETGGDVVAVSHVQMELQLLIDIALHVCAPESQVSMQR
jgi:hypothetical protein